MGNPSGESREQNRKDKVTRFRSVTYARQPGLLVNTLGSHLKWGKKEKILSEVCMVKKKQHVTVLFTSDVMKKSIFKRLVLLTTRFVAKIYL